MLIENGLESFEIEIFFDGGCPLCAREMKWLRRRAKANRIRFTDINDPNLDAGACGKLLEELMAQMHGRLPDGTWLLGVEVFRRIYSAIRLPQAGIPIATANHCSSLGRRLSALRELSTSLDRALHRRRVLPGQQTKKPAKHRLPSGGCTGRRLNASDQAVRHAHQHCHPRTASETRKSAINAFVIQRHGLR
jgi:hypothetical protein